MAIPLDAKGVEKDQLAVRVGDDLKEAMRSCLRWDPKKRAKIPELLKGEFLRGKEVVPGSSFLLSRSNRILMDFYR